MTLYEVMAWYTYLHILISIWWHSSICLLLWLLTTLLSYNLGIICPWILVLVLSFQVPAMIWEIFAPSSLLCLPARFPNQTSFEWHWCLNHTTPKPLQDGINGCWLCGRQLQVLRTWISSYQLVTSIILMDEPWNQFLWSTLSPDEHCGKNIIRCGGSVVGHSSASQSPLLQAGLYLGTPQRTGCLMRLPYPFIIWALLGW